MIYFILLPLCAVAAIWYGFVIAKLWLWFLVPFGLPAVGIAHAAGLHALAAMLCKVSGGKADSNPDWSKLFVRVIVNGAVPLFIGWIAHSLM